MSSPAVHWRLDRSSTAPVAAPELDADQQRVVEHASGPLLVLAGPGTGKTTTIVESVLARLADPVAPLDPSEVLVLTFGRRAAAELRTRILRRSSGAARVHVATFHSFAYGLMRQLAPADEFLAPPRLLSGPEQQTRIRELLLGALADGRLVWPETFHEAVRTRGFAEQVRTLVAAVRAQALDGVDLVQLGDSEGFVAWQAAGRFIEEYLEVTEFEGVLDYTEVLLQAALAAERDPTIRRQYRAIYVDEYQDTDPLQVRLLQALTTPATALVAVGDPDQAIYSFRGADVRGLLRFREQFATGRDPVPTVVLSRTRRFGPVLREAATRVIGDVLPAGLDVNDVRKLRNSECDPGSPAGSLEVFLADDERTQADHVADLLRRAALDPANPVAWSDMAVLVRSGTHQIPALRRALVSAGVPVEVAGDEVPIAREPAVAPILLAAEVVADDGRLTPEIAEALLTSPLGGIDPADLRRLVRELRRREREQLEATEHGDGHRQRPAPSGESLVAVLRDTSVLDALPAGPLSDIGRAVTRMAELIDHARGVLASGATPAEVLWVLWSGTRWPERLRRAALGTGGSARRAHADLDAVMALFDEAERATEVRGGVAGLGSFVDELSAQEIPGRGLRESVVGGDAVRLLTAHRAKGLEWRLVVVVGVQDGTWPDTRKRGTLLAADTIGSDLAGAPIVVPQATPGALLAEERRLFYVACTRARERLVVTAVASPDVEGGEQPSRFLDDLAGQAVEFTIVASAARRVADVSPRALSLPALVADLRRALSDPSLPDDVRAAAADRLALLATALAPDGRSVTTAADPDRWWGGRELTDPGVPMRDPDRPLRLSGTGIELVTTCALRWFLEREVHAEVPGTTSAGFGLVVHAVADLVARGLLDPDPAVIDEAVDRVWSTLPYEAPWRSNAERERARDMLARFLHWHLHRGRALIGTEVEFAVEVPVNAPDGTPDVVALGGSMDVVEAEVSDDGLHLFVADLKTGSTPPASRVDEHVQLGVYQVAVQHGAASEAIARAGFSPDSPVHSGGAAIIGLKDAEGKGKPGPKVIEQQPIPGDGTAAVLAVMGQAAATVRGEVFSATDASACGYCSFQSMCPAKGEGQEVTP